MESSTQKTELAPESNLVWAILATLLCCWPFGIPAIVNAAKVDRYWFAGHKEEAIKAAQNAKKWSIISAVSALIFWVIYSIVIISIGCVAAC